MKHEPIRYDQIISNLPLETLEILGTILSHLNRNKARGPWYTLKEAGEYLRCGVTTIRRLIDEGQLKCHRLDQRVEKSTILIHKKDMDALILCGRCRGLQPREQKLVRAMQA